MPRLIWLSLLFLLACQSPSKKEAPSPPPPEDLQEVEVKVEEHAVPVLASCDATSIGLEEYQRALHLAAIRGNPHSEKTLADPKFQRAMLLFALKLSVLEEEARAAMLSVSDEEIYARLKRDPILGEKARTMRWEALLPALSEETGIPSADLHVLLLLEALEDRLAESLLSALDDDTIWREHAQRYALLHLTVVRLLNLPSPSEISDFVKKHPNEISHYYEVNRSAYTSPDRAYVRQIFLTIPAPGGPEQEATIRARLEDLHMRALKEDFEALAAAHTENPRAAKRGGLMPAITKAALPAAFAMKPGDISPIEPFRNGLHFYQLVSTEAGYSTPLDEALKREIASILIRDAGPAPSIEGRFKEVIEALRGGSDPSLHFGEIPGDVFNPEPFSAPFNDHLPGIGRVPCLMKAIRKLERPGETTSSCTSGQFVWAARLEKRTPPDRASFESNIEQHRENARRIHRPTIVEEYLSQKVVDAKLDLRSIQKIYGLQRADGSIERLTPTSSP